MQCTLDRVDSYGIVSLCLVQSTVTSFQLEERVPSCFTIRVWIIDGRVSSDGAVPLGAKRSDSNVCLIPRCPALQISRRTASLQRLGTLDAPCEPILLDDSLDTLISVPSNQWLGRPRVSKTFEIHGRHPLFSTSANHLRRFWLVRGRLCNLSISGAM